MKRIIALTAMLCLAPVAARADLVTVQSAAGPITVASDVAHKFVSLIDDLVSRGFRGRVHCYASGGHVRHSQHYSGRACDFSQTGWNKTVHPMYSSTALIKAHGLRDGCTFRHPRKDCGHVDAGLTRSPVVKLWAYGHRHRVYAHIGHHQRQTAASSAPSYFGGWSQPKPEVHHHRGHHHYAHHHRGHHARG